MSVIEHWPERIALQTTERGRPMPGLYRSLWPGVPPLQDDEVEYVRADQLAGAVDLLRDVATSGVAFEDPRIDYLEVQIDRDTWEALAAYRGGQS
jgi:hypothetical protein